jgi:DNA-damage-inducible protein J
MAETTNLNIRIDKELKEQAEVFFTELGLNMSSAFNIFVRQSLRQGKIPFELSLVAEPYYSSTGMEASHQSIKKNLARLNEAVVAYESSTAKRKLDFIKAPPLPDSFFEPLSEEELQAWGL